MSHSRKARRRLDRIDPSYTRLCAGFVFSLAAAAFTLGLATAAAGVPIW